MTAEPEPGPTPDGYLVPARPLHRVEDVVRRSRFITSIGPAAEPDTARAFIHAIESELPDATHHCWGFVAGPPGSTAHVGLSDAGEPHGTAGRPILNALLHSEVGEVVAVVTRYFGGVKLGKGGLGRAYAAGVAHGLASLPTALRVERLAVRITVPFRAADALFRMLEETGARDREERYTSRLEVSASIPAAALERIRGEVAAATSGEGSVEAVPPGSAE